MITVVDTTKATFSSAMAGSIPNPESIFCINVDGLRWENELGDNDSGQKMIQIYILGHTQTSQWQVTQRVWQSCVLPVRNFDILHG